MDAHAAQLRRQMDATRAAMDAMLTRVARLGCCGTWEQWTGLAGTLRGGSTPTALGSCAPGLRAHAARGCSRGARTRVS